MHSSDDLHLVEEVIDDLSAVEEFEKEATKIQPLEIGRTAEDQVFEINIQLTTTSSSCQP